jgi:selenocysteine-specific elongation factor
MKSITIGTAGHVDHGKTALVKALTGIDADRLAEEKRRGITLDLGFAHMDLPLPNGGAMQLGFVDVPGHERFVRNMLAGAGGIDLVLLVIAADEAIKPQTREHFHILQLLGVQHGITVLTKSDAVDADTLEVVRLEVEEFLRGTFLDVAQSPLIAVSSLTGAGLEELRRALVATATKLPPRDSQAITRLPVDRVFTMKGFGTVVTGTLVTGMIRREDELEVFPTARKVRVRGVQVHGRVADEAVAGQRTALNLAGVSAENLSRGMTLAPSETLEVTRNADVRLGLLASAPRVLKNRARVHFHSYSMETLAEIVLHDTKPVAPGDETFARLKLSKPALLLPGDRFIIRQFSPVVTIGGGVVLDATPVLRTAFTTDFLKSISVGDKKAVLEARIARRRHEGPHQGMTTARLVAETGWTKNVIDIQLAEALSEGSIVSVGERFMPVPELESLKSRLTAAVLRFHRANPLVGGIGKEELRTQFDLASGFFDAVIAMIIRDKKLEVVSDIMRLPGHGVVMKDDEAESKGKIEDAFASAGLQVPSLREVIAGLKVDRIRAEKIVTLLLRNKVLIKVSDELVFHRTALEALRTKVAAHKSKSSKIDVAAFKELIGVTRKYAIPLLEYLDRERVTKRVGNAREILL